MVGMVAYAHEESKAAAAPPSTGDDDEEVLDLSAFMAAEPLVDEEGSATSWGGSLDDEDDFKRVYHVFHLGKMD